MSSYHLEKSRALSELLAGPAREGLAHDAEQLIREGADPNGGAHLRTNARAPGPFLVNLALACVNHPADTELHEVLLRAQAHIEHARINLEETIADWPGRPSKNTVAANLARGERALQRAVERFAARTQLFLSGEPVSVLGELVAAPWNDHRAEAQEHLRRLTEASTGPARSEADANATSRRKAQDAAPPHKTVG